MTKCTGEFMPTAVYQKNQPHLTEQRIAESTTANTVGIRAVSMAPHLIYSATAAAGNYSEFTETQKGQCENNCLR
jgi:hypothetical protein